MCSTLVSALALSAVLHARQVADEVDTSALASTEHGWELGLSGYQYFLPDGRDYFQPTLTMDRDALHLEARYNYEDLDTASAWVGYNLSFGEEVTLELTPLIGLAFGRTSGLALGYSGQLEWWRLGLSSESEYLFDFEDQSESFLYNWSELTIAPADWWWTGLVSQRTRVYESEREIQRGFLLGASYGAADFTGYVFDPDLDDAVYALALELSF